MYVHFLSTIRYGIRGRSFCQEVVRKIVGLFPKDFSEIVVNFTEESRWVRMKGDLAWDVLSVETNCDVQQTNRTGFN